MARRLVLEFHHGLQRRIIVLLVPVHEGALHEIGRAKYERFVSGSEGGDDDVAGLASRLRALGESTFRGEEGSIERGAVARNTLIEFCILRREGVGIFGVEELGPFRLGFGTFGCACRIVILINT